MKRFFLILLAVIVAVLTIGFFRLTLEPKVTYHRR